MTGGAARGAVGLAGRRIVLGVSGSIAAYKAVQLARDLTEAGAEVDVVMTEGATRFVAPLTFSTLTRRPVHTDLWSGPPEAAETHVALGARAELLLVAPATAGTLARLALGLADDLLSLTALATGAPLVVAPAMNHRMWAHPATREHVNTLEERGALVLPPGVGRLASGEHGAGRLPEPGEIIGAVRWRLGRGGRLAGRRIVVTAGGTREPLDPVRYLTNGSSGRMGYALAAAALDEGADVALVSAPVESMSPPWGAEMVPVATAQEMLGATERACAGADALIMAAAVSDYRPRHPSERKLKKRGGPLALELEENPDIVATLARSGLLTVGFAAETDDLLARARAKLTSKGLDLIVANDAATIGAADAALTLLYTDGLEVELERLPKDAAAARVVDAVATLLAERASRPGAP